MNSRKRSILMPVLVFAVAMLAAAPAEAAQPFIMKIPLDVIDTFSDCGFQVVHHTEGFFTVHVFFDTNGNPRMEIDTFALTESYTNPANGISVSTRDVGPDIITFQQDGSFTVATIGLVSHIVVKGQGETAARVGKIVATFDADGNFIGIAFEAGKHDDLLPAICAALA